MACKVAARPRRLEPRIWTQEPRAHFTAIEDPLRHSARPAAQPDFSLREPSGATPASRSTRFMPTAALGALPLVAACAKSNDYHAETLTPDQPEVATASIFSEHPYITGGTVIPMLVGAAVMLVKTKALDFVFGGAIGHVSKTLWEHLRWGWQWEKVGKYRNDDEVFEEAVAHNNPLAIKGLLARASSTDKKLLSLLNQLATRYPEHARKVVDRIKELILSDNRPTPALYELIKMSLNYVAFSENALEEISQARPALREFIQDAIAQATETPPTPAPTLPAAAEQTTIAPNTELAERMAALNKMAASPFAIITTGSNFPDIHENFRKQQSGLLVKYVLVELPDGKRELRIQPGNVRHNRLILSSEKIVAAGMLRSDRAKTGWLITGSSGGFPTTRDSISLVDNLWDNQVPTAAAQAGLNEVANYFTNELGLSVAIKDTQP